MSTDALSAAKIVSQPVVRRPVNRAGEHMFFGCMAVLLCLIVFIGFSPTYFRAGMLRAPLPSPIVHVHGAVFTLWMVLFLVQSAFISARRVAWHRTLGTIAFCLPPLMLVLGVVASADALKRGARIGTLDSPTSLAIPLLGILTFAIVIAASWMTRRQPDAHKRYILLATIGLTGAAFGRIPWEHMGIPGLVGLTGGQAVLMLALVIFDLVALHRVHRSTAWAAPFTFVMGLIAAPVGATAAWHGFAAWFGRTLGPHV